MAGVGGKSCSGVFIFVHRGLCKSNREPRKGAASGKESSAPSWRETVLSQLPFLLMWHHHFFAKKVKTLVAQLCLTLCDPMDCSPSRSSAMGILQATTLVWVAIPFCRGSSWPSNRTWVSCIAGRFFTESPGELQLCCNGEAKRPIVTLTSHQEGAGHSSESASRCDLCKPEVYFLKLFLLEYSCFTVFC